MNTNFKGPFKDLLSDFIKFKRQMGFKYVRAAEILKSFSEFSLKLGLKEPTLSK